ncbi:MAG: TonB family protein [Actinomycetota bacterium]
MLSVTKTVMEPQVTHSEHPLRLLVKTEPWLRVFLRNLGDMLRREPPQVWLTARPGEYWPDALVHRPVAWSRIRQSFLGHTLLVLSVYWVTLLWLNRPQVVVEDVPRTTIMHYQLSEYLPPVSAHREQPAPPARMHSQKADPELAKQEIVSIHPEPTSLKQTIVHPSARLLTQDTPLPNIVAWTAIPAAPVAARRRFQELPSEYPQVVPPAEPPAQRSHLIFPVFARPEAVPPAEPISANRPVPSVPSAAPEVVPPAGSIAGAHREPALPLAGAIVVPPSERPVARMRPLHLPAQAPEVVEPASSIAARHRLGRALPVNAPQVVPPPEPVRPRALNALATTAAPQTVVPPPEPIVSGGEAQSRAMGHLLALNARPVAPVGPVSVPEGNLRGEFAASPAGRRGATARPEIALAGPNGSNAGNESSPANLYVSAPPVKIAADAVVAAPHPTAARPFVPSNTDTPSNRIENEVFGLRRRYSIRLSMPNLNSAIGSWIMRYARLNSAPGTVEDVTPPEPLHKVDPAYPATYVHDRVEGEVVLYGIIHSDGSVGNVRVLEGFDSVLDENARVALTEWRFRPATRNGVPVDVEVVVRVPFRAPKESF